MKQPKLIQRMIQKREEKKLNKPRYKIEDLYIGEIVRILDKHYAGQSHPSQSLLGYMIAMQYEYTHKTIKPFAIFKAEASWSDTFTHILTNHSLKKMLYGDSLEYTVHQDSIKKFNGVMHQYMIENNLKNTSKLSINQIKEIEREVNLRINPNQNQDELFY